MIFHTLTSKYPFLSSQTKTHLSALFAWNSWGHWGECSPTQVVNCTEILFTYSTTVFFVSKLRHSALSELLSSCIPLAQFICLLRYWLVLFVLHFRCRTLSGSPRPKSFKKIHFIKNMRQHDMRNGRYEHCHPLVNTSPQWIMACCPSQWTAVWMFLTFQATS